MKHSYVLILAAIALHAEISVMPMPSSVAMGTGTVAVTEKYRVKFEGYREKRMDDAVKRIVKRAPASVTIQCTGAAAAVQNVGEDESYKLEVAASGAVLSAANPLGVLHGLQTLAQLVDGTTMPVVKIEDTPRFAWRGMLIDVARHFMPLETLHRNLDGMAVVKMNVFHWHLSDDQGFRVESKVYPKLQGEGSDRKFYTQAEIRGLIAYARERGIRVVPEFDVPGHTSSWLVGYPELATDPRDLKIGRVFGVYDPAMDPTKDAVYPFLDKFLGEMAALFPDEYLHIGGDEVNGKQWSASETIQAYEKAHQMPAGKPGNEALQAYFNEKLLAILKEHGKKMEGWDEILNPALPKDIVIQSWRGQKSLAEAARSGFTGILSSGYYLDHMDKAATHYAVDPMAKECADLSTGEQQKVLGGESCMWGEYVSPENIDGRIWPRNAVIAERLWSAASVTDAADMYRRLEHVSGALEAAGVKHRVNYRAMCARLAAGGSVNAVKTLADVVESSSLSVRHRAHDYHTDEPLNRLPDTAIPESDIARKFVELTARAKSDPAVRAEIRKWLALWRDNEAKLAPVIASSALMKDAKPVSETLASVSRLGLEALDAIEAGIKLDAKWTGTAKTKLTAAARPVDEVRIAVVPGVAKLAELAAQ